MLYIILFTDGSLQFYYNKKTLSHFEPGARQFWVRETVQAMDIMDWLSKIHLYAESDLVKEVREN